MTRRHSKQRQSLIQHLQWKPVRCSLSQLLAGGRLVINAIRKEEKDKAELLALDYERDLWQEKSIRSVANVTRKDVRQCLELAVQIPLVPGNHHIPPWKTPTRPLREIRQGGLRGAKVLLIE